MDILNAIIVLDGHLMVKWLSRGMYMVETEVLKKIRGILEIMGAALAAENWLRVYSLVGVQTSHF